MFLKKSIIYAAIILSIFNLEAKYTNINSMKEYTKACSNGNPIIIMYSASWCQPCQFMKPIFSSLSRKYKDIGFYVVDTSISQLNPLVKKNSISGLPTTVMYDKENKEIKRERGGLSKKELANSIEDFAKTINKPKEIKAVTKDKIKVTTVVKSTTSVKSGNEVKSSNQTKTKPEKSSNKETRTTKKLDEPKTKIAATNIKETSKKIAVKTDTKKTTIGSASAKTKVATNKI